MKLRLAYCVIGVCLVGCTPSQPSTKSSGSTGKGAAHSHEHAAPATLPEALKQLSAHAETIGKAFLAETPNDAHDSLHDVGYVLESFPILAKDLSDEKKAAIKKSADELFECFGALDETMHGGIETPYSKVGERIKTALSSLKSAIE